MKPLDHENKADLSNSEAGTSSSYDLPSYFDDGSLGLFFHLPEHLKLDIFCRLELVDLAVLSLLNRTFHGSVTKLLSLNYKTELEDRQQAMRAKRRLEHARKFWFLTYTK